jgi:hypothetical protein
MKTKFTILAVGGLFFSMMASAYAEGEGACLKSRDKAAGIKTAVFNATAELDSRSGWVKGLQNKFCIFTSTENTGMVDLQTLTSKRPSIAATYIVNGLDMAELMKVVPEGYSGNPATLFCQALAGSSITRYTDGGFATKLGQDEVCVFGDGSKVSMWSLVYLSDDPDYLSIRKAVRSEPLQVDLPYMK